MWILKIKTTFSLPLSSHQFKFSFLIKLPIILLFLLLISVNHWEMWFFYWYLSILKLMLLPQEICKWLFPFLIWDPSVSSLTFPLFPVFKLSLIWFLNFLLNCYFIVIITFNLKPYNLLDLLVSRLLFSYLLSSILSALQLGSYFESSPTYTNLILVNVKMVARLYSLNKYDQTHALFLLVLS